jgi:hypothetical protein
MLQGGLGDTRYEDRDRGGQPDSYHEKMEVFGCAEDRSSQSSRVVSIEILELADYERYGLGDAEYFIVYDIEVAGNHNFVADSIVVHNCFKNCAAGGEETSGIAYLSNPTVSKRGVDLSMKMSYLRDTRNGRGAYLLTATPLTNSPLETFNMLSHVAPLEEFEQFGVYNVDDFVRVFGDIQPVDKLMLDGSLKSKDGLVGFKNLDGLRNIFFKYCYQKSASDFPDQIKLPEQVDTPQDLDLSDDQERAYSALKDEASDAMSGDKDERKKARPVFSILRDMEKVATDLDLYHRTITFTFSKADMGKAKGIIAKLPDHVKVKRVPTFGEDGYDDSLEEQKAIEMKIPLQYAEKEAADAYTVSFPDAYESLVVGRFKEVGIDEQDVAHPLTPKYAKLIENCKTEFELGGKQIIFTEEKTQHEKITRILVHHIPAIKSAIAIINADEASGDKLQQISDNYNNGTFRFVVCNKKAEVGVNLQKGTTAIHHLTFPWTPASIQQRNGRGVRQGNKSSRVRVYYYQAGFDSYKVQLLNRKASWIKDIMHGKESSAENGGIMGVGDIQVMLSNNPEEAKARILEQQAEKSRKAKEYSDKQSLITLQKLANNTSVLIGLDDAKAKKRASLEEKIPDLERKIARYRDRGITLPKGDEERKRLGKMIIDAQAQLDKAKGELGRLDSFYESYKVSIENSLKKDKLTLKAKADREGLPFDKDLIENPGKAAMSPSGKMVCLGDMYEVANVVKSRSSYESGTFKAIIKIIGFSDDRKNIELEILTGKLANYAGSSQKTWSIADFFEKLNPVKVSYSEDEIRLKELLSQDHNYFDLTNGAISKDVFQNHYDEIKWGKYSSNGGYLLVLNGGYKFSSYVEDGFKVAYPDKDSAIFKKEVCEAYLNEQREGNGYSSGKVMGLIFGPRYDDLALEYGKKATEAEVIAELNRLFKEYLDEPAQDGKPLKDHSAQEIYDTMCSYYKGGMDRKLRAVDKMADNDDDIRDWKYAFESERKKEYRDKISEEKAAAESKRLEGIKNDPNYKEVPEEVKKAFDDLGITVKSNMGELILPAFKGRSERIDPFNRWFFQDRAGFSGKIYKIKDILKIRYKAQFFKDAGGAFNGAWWHVPSDVDLSEIYKLIA